MFNFHSTTFQYEALRKLFSIIPAIVSPIIYMIDAPFGRFSLANDSIFSVDGIKSWIIMELVAPITYTYTFIRSPLNLLPNFTPHLKLYQPATLLSALFLLHYLNRAILSPLRAPSRSKSHIIVPFCGITFNLVNNYLMGAYLSSPAARQFLNGAFGQPTFWLGIALALLGFAGNVLHDEILFDIRRNAKAKGKGKDESNGSPESKRKTKEHYAIPHGWLYDYVSCPNYLCEWVEWFGFALAAAPLPLVTSQLGFFATIHPPWIFLLAEVLLMSPRALKTHQWYQNKFPDYPKDRTAVIPFLL